MRVVETTTSNRRARVKPVGGSAQNAVVFGSVMKEELVFVLLGRTDMFGEGVLSIILKFDPYGRAGGNRKNPRRQPCFRGRCVGASLLSTSCRPPAACGSAQRREVFVSVPGGH